MARWRSCALLRLGDHARQLAALVQLDGNVAAADQLAVDEQLREGRPVGIARQVGADLRILQYVDAVEAGGAGRLQRLHGAAGEAAHRELRRTLHEQDDRVRLDHRLDAVHDAHAKTPLRGRPPGRGAMGLELYGLGAAPRRHPRNEPETAMAIGLPPLPYDRTALEPHISAETIDYHYGKHHQTYVTNLNNQIKGTEFENLDLEAIIRKAQGGMFNNAAQVWNHTFYWNCLKPNGGGEPTGKLADAINKAFGSFAAFKEQFTQTAITTFGSGWAWLVQRPDGSLALVSTPNAATPITGN